MRRTLITLLVLPTLACAGLSYLDFDGRRVVKAAQSCVGIAADPSLEAVADCFIDVVGALPEGYENRTELGADAVACAHAVHEAEVLEAEGADASRQRQEVEALTRRLSGRPTK
jgi:hypothetical protein